MGVVSARIAAHSGDIAKGLPGAVDRDRAMSVCRKELDWEGRTCTMCGRLCAKATHNSLQNGGCGD